LAVTAHVGIRANGHLGCLPAFAFYVGRFADGAGVCDTSTSAHLFPSYQRLRVLALYVGRSAHGALDREVRA
jgi:hypothetical protein